MLCYVLIWMPVFIFHFSGAGYCSFTSVLRNNSSEQIPGKVYWPEGAKWEKLEHQSVVAHTFTFIVQQSQHSLPSNIYCVKKHHLCSEPANRRTLVIIPTVPLYCDGNGTLNQCLAPSGFITRWQPIVAALGWQQVALEGGLEKVRQMVQRDDNGAISQRILHLWRDGGCCRGLLMPAEMNAMDEHISYWQPPYRCWLRCLDTHNRELWKQTLWSIAQLFFSRKKFLETLKWMCQ